MSSEIKSIKRKKTSYHKPRANNYANKVAEGHHKKQGKREKQSHYQKKVGDYKQNIGRKDDDRKTNETRVKPRFPWRVCSETTHGNLLECQNSRSTFQVNQEDQLVHLKKSA